MMSIIIKIGNDIDRSEWSEFVEKHPNGNIFQMPEMYDGYCQTPGHTPMIFAASSNGLIVGILLAVILEEGGIIKAKFSRRSIIIGGPLVSDDNEAIISELLQAYNNNISNQVIYSQIRNHWDQLAHCDLFRNAGYEFKSHLNFLIPLGTDEEMWSRIGKGRAKQIRKAQKNNLKVDVYYQSEVCKPLIEIGYHIIEHVYQRAGLPLANIQLLFELSRSGRLIQFVVRKEGVIIGCRFGLAFNKNVYGWYAGSYDQYYNLFPNDLLIWETLRWCAAHNYKVFDYCGAGSPNKQYGVRVFKQQMGGILVNYGRYEKVHKPIMYRIGILGMALYKLIDNKTSCQINQAQLNK